MNLIALFCYIGLVCDWGHRIYVYRKVINEMELSGPFLLPSLIIEGILFIGLALWH
jgi:hypothetical protein